MAFYPRMFPSRGACEDRETLHLQECAPNAVQEPVFLKCNVWITYGFSMG